MRRLLLAAALLTMALPACAQTDEAGIRNRLIGQPLILRGFYANDKLEFDGSGVPKATYQVTSPTMSGMDVQEVHVSGNTLRLMGVRMALEWHGSEGSKNKKLNMIRVPVPVSEKKDAPPEKLSVEVKGTKDFGPALDAIFATDFADLGPTLPEYWQRFVRKMQAEGVQKRLVDPSSETKTSDAAATSETRQSEVVPLNGVPGKVGQGGIGPAGEVVTRNKTVPSSQKLTEPLPNSGAADVPKPVHVGGSVTPPKLIYQVDPVFSREARRSRYSGMTQVYLIVGADGVPKEASIWRAAGHGLDEKAIEAVRQYRFTPAKRNGEPVAVDLYIDVNFQIF